MTMGKHWRKPSPNRPAISGAKRKGGRPERTDAGTRAAKMTASSCPARTIAMSYLNGEIRILEEILGFAVVVEGIVYGVYSSARESAYIADSLRASGLICEICRYE